MKSCRLKITAALVTIPGALPSAAMPVSNPVATGDVSTRVENSFVVRGVQITTLRATLLPAFIPAAVLAGTARGRVGAVTGTGWNRMVDGSEGAGMAAG